MRRLMTMAAGVLMTLAVCASGAQAAQTRVAIHGDSFTVAGKTYHLTPKPVAARLARQAMAREKLAWPVDKPGHAKLRFPGPCLGNCLHYAAWQFMVSRYSFFYEGYRNMPFDYAYPPPVNDPGNVYNVGYLWNGRISSYQIIGRIAQYRRADVGFGTWPLCRIDVTYTVNGYDAPYPGYGAGPGSQVFQSGFNGLGDEYAYLC